MLGTLARTFCRIPLACLLGGLVELAVEMLEPLRYEVLDAGRDPKPEMLLRLGLLGMWDRGTLAGSPARSASVLRLAFGSGTRAYTSDLLRLFCHLTL